MVQEEISVMGNTFFPVAANIFLNYILVTFRIFSNF
jgi:hypothetical protein